MMDERAVIGALVEARSRGKGFDMAASTVVALLDEIEAERVSAVADAKDQIEAIVLPSVMKASSEFREEGRRHLERAAVLADQTLELIDTHVGRGRTIGILCALLACCCFVLGLQLAHVVAP